MTGPLVLLFTPSQTKMSLKMHNVFVTTNIILQSWMQATCRWALSNLLIQASVELNCICINKASVEHASKNHDEF